MNTKTILIEEGYWMNSQLSLARFYGSIRFNGEKYVVVPPKNDLLLAKWVPVYKKLGRDETVKLIKKGTDLKEALNIAKTPKTSKTPKGNVEQLKLDL